MTFMCPCRAGLARALWAACRVRERRIFVMDDAGGVTDRMKGDGAGSRGADSGVSPHSGAVRAVHPEEWLKSHLSHGIHPDGRSVRATRPTTVSTGVVKSADGSALVKVGRSSVLTGITCEVGTPAAITPLQGKLEIGVELSPLCSTRYSIGAPPAESYALAQFMYRTITEAKLFDLEELCIEEGESAWVLRVDVVCLDHSGNLNDVALLSVMAALQDLRIPEPVLGEETSDGRKRRVFASPDVQHPLKLSAILVPLTFALVGGIVVPDPTLEEEDAADTVFTVVRTDTGMIAAVHKPGGVAIEPSVLSRCVKMCQSRVDQVLPLLSESE